MVQTFKSTVRVYEYPFELVMKAYEKRFPTCPEVPIVLACEVTKDELSSCGNKRTTTRRCTLAVEAPYIVKKMMGVDVVFFIQTNVLNSLDRTLDINATNESFANRVEIVEICRYYAHPDNAQWTCFEQDASLYVKNFCGLESKIEKLGMKQYIATSKKGKEILQGFIDQVVEEENAALERSKLEITEQIPKHLKELSEEHESKLLEFRKMVRESNRFQPIPEYGALWRFLKARDLNLEKSFQMLEEHINWRRDNHIDSLADNYMIPVVISDHFLGSWHHVDKANHPLFLLRLGYMDLKGTLKAIGTEGLMKLTVFICEKGLEKIKENCAPNWSLIIDLDGMSMRHLWRPGVKAVLKIIETVEKNYPETLGRVLVVRAPRIFPLAWTIISAFIPENTRSKFLCYSGNSIEEAKTVLEGYIDSHYMPDIFGGPCETNISKNFELIDHQHFTRCFLTKCNCSLIHEDIPNIEISSSKEYTPIPRSITAKSNIYRFNELDPSMCFEIIVKNRDLKALLTWDFDVVAGSIKFTVFRTSRDLTNINCSFLDLPNMFEGSNYHRIQSTVTCSASESCQGSHVMNTFDSYVLNWLNLESSKDVARVNYFYEVLDSKYFKGSLSSLLSTSDATSSSYLSR